MRRIVFRIFAVGVFAVGGWIYYQVSDFTSCSGPRAEAWLNSTLEILENSTIDFDASLSAKSLSIFSSIANRTEDRYMAQQAKDAPACLSTLQEHTSTFLFYEWKAYESVSNADLQGAGYYMDQALAAQDALEREFYRLAAKYEWEID